MIFHVLGWRHRPSAGPGCLALGSGLTVPLAATHMGDSGLRGVFRAIAQATGRDTRERKAASGIPGNGGHRHAGPGGLEASVPGRKGSAWAHETNLSTAIVRAPSAGPGTAAAQRDSTRNDRGAEGEGGGVAGRRAARRVCTSMDNPALSSANVIVCVAGWRVRLTDIDYVRLVLEYGVRHERDWCSAFVFAADTGPQRGSCRYRVG